ncbi:MAG: ACP S-malonyltransferase [Acidiferrobacter sp.]
MADRGSIAFIFPGQGSQSVGMLKALAAKYDEVQAVFAEASAGVGYDLWPVVAEGPEARLNQTAVTQPALLAADVACYRVWRSAGGPAPSWMAGHSLGEYAALVCAGAMTLTDGVALVAARGRFMQEAVPAGKGAMAAILGLDDDAVRALCVAQAGGDVLTAVNYNSPGQVVIAGTHAAIGRAVAAARAAGAKRALVLPVSVPSHCALMAGAAARLGEQLAAVTIYRPAIRVLHNCHVATADTPEDIREALVRQLDSPVRWVETITTLMGYGITRFYECGPGKVLTGLTKRIAGASCTAIGEPDDMATALAQMLADTEGRAYGAC